MTSETEPTKVDLAASEACVRSGTFALLLSVALLLLVPSWREQPNYAALRRYLGDRIVLASLVDQLDDDPFWQKYKALNPGAESTSIAELLRASVVVSSSSSSEEEKVASKIAPPPRHQAQKASSPIPGPPEPPTGLSAVATVTVAVHRLQDIADTLGQLNDSDVLTRSRHISNFFRFSIARWLDKRNGLAFRNQVTNKCFTEQLEVPNQVKTSDDFVPELRNDGLLKCLTFRDVEELAHMEVPALLGPPQLGEHVGPQIDVTLGSSLPHDLYVASILAQLLLFFMMVHFSAFVREAVSSPHFPAAGTLFSAFSRSRPTLFIFILATFVPPLASACVCWASWGSDSKFHIVSLFVCTVCIFWAFFSIQRVLWRTSYFKGLMHRGN
jgi:hypothetical protein